MNRLSPDTIFKSVMEKTANSQIINTESLEEATPIRHRTIIITDEGA